MLNILNAHILNYIFLTKLILIINRQPEEDTETPDVNNSQVVSNPQNSEQEGKKKKRKRKRKNQQNEEVMQ